MQSWPLLLSIAGAALLLALLALLALRARSGARRRPPDGDAPAAESVRVDSRASTTIADPLSPYRAACADALQRLHLLAFGAEPVNASGTASAAGATTEQEAVGMTVRSILAHIVERPNYAPRRPMLLPRLIQAMRDDEVSRREIARIIASDPVLAGNLVRLANSPLYRHGDAAIESLDRAVAVLGTEGMRSLATAALLQPVFRISGRHFARFGEITWKHTFLASSAAESHAAVVENSDPFAAQLLALIMGLGTIVVFRVATDAYLERRILPVASTIAGLIDSELVPVARQIASGWDLSERMDIALADQAATAEATTSPLGRSLQFGRFAGALALLRMRALIDDQAAEAALRTAGPQAEACTRIWARLVSAQE